MDPPSPEALENALEQLVLLKAVEKKDGIVQLTSLGHQMVCFPLEPQLGKAILSASEFSCTEEVLTVVALLSVDSLLYTPNNMKDVAKKRHAKFISSEGDHITLLNIYKAYKATNGNKDWCMENFINMRAMKNVLDIRKQLRDICVRLEIPLVSCGKATSVLRHCLATGLFLQSAELQLDGTFQTLFRKQTVAIHPSSALFQCKPAYVVYNELVHTSKCYMRDISLVDPDWLVGAAPEFFREHRIQSNSSALKS